MKFSLIKHHKAVNKKKYLSHQHKESLIWQTLPSFAQAYRAYNRQKKSSILHNSWTNKTISLAKEKQQDVVITWLGHASFLIQYYDINIITDPVFGSLPFFPRLTHHGLPVDSLPSIDAILISHNHHDHMDFSTLSHLAYRNRNISISVPTGDKRWLPPSLFTKIHEHAWYDQFILESSLQTIVNCTFLPAYHWSRRGLFDTNQSLWGSWLIQCGEQNIYFGGDSAYFEHFAEIGNSYKIDIALLPIAPIEPFALMTRSHMNPTDAGQAFFDLNATILIPMHWGTFQFGTDNHEDPVFLMQQWQKNNSEKLISEKKKVHILKIGESFGYGNSI